MTKENITKVKTKLDNLIAWHEKTVTNDNTNYMLHYRKIINKGLELLSNLENCSREELDTVCLILRDEFEPDYSHVESFNELSNIDKTLLNASYSAIGDLAVTVKQTLGMYSKETFEDV